MSIDACGHRKVDGTTDPRGLWYNEPICGVDGGEYVSRRGWYYRGSGELSGSHTPQALEQVYRLTLEGTASASASKAEGSLSPGLDYISALPQSWDRWGGSGHIDLSITELDGHLPFYIWGTYYECDAFTAKKHEWNPTEDAEIAVTVNFHTYEETKTSKVYAEGEYEGNGSFSGKFGGSYSESWRETYVELKGISHGIQAEVGYGGWGTFWHSAIKLQQKEANVSGDLDEKASVSMTANYSEADPTLCPGDPSVGQRKFIVHSE